MPAIRYEGGCHCGRVRFAVHHDPVRPAYGYRFDYGGRSVVVSGDTTRDASLIAAARGADVLFHEAQANPLVAMIGAAATVANEAGVALLVRWRLLSDVPAAGTVFSRATAD